MNIVTVIVAPTSTITKSMSTITSIIMRSIA